MQANPGRVPPRPCNTAAGLGGCMGESMSTGAETLLHPMFVSMHKVLCFPLLCHIAVEDSLLHRHATHGPVLLLSNRHPPASCAAGHPAAPALTWKEGMQRMSRWSCSRYSRAWHTAMMALHTASGPIPAQPRRQGAAGVRDATGSGCNGVGLHGLSSAGNRAADAPAPLARCLWRAPAVLPLPCGYVRSADAGMGTPGSVVRCGQRGPPSARCGDPHPGSAPVMLGQPPSRARLEMAPATTVGLLPLPAVSSLGCSIQGKAAAGDAHAERRVPCAKAACHLLPTKNCTGMTATSMLPWCATRSPVLMATNRASEKRADSSGAQSGAQALPRTHVARAALGSEGGTADLTFWITPSVARFDLDVTYSASELAMLLLTRGHTAVG